MSVVRVVQYYIYHVLVLFAFLFQFSIIGGLTTRRLAVCVAAVSLLRHKEHALETLKSFKSNSALSQYIIGMLICGVISYINVYSQTGLDNRYFQPWYFLNMYLYVFLFAWYQVTEYCDLRKMAYTYFLTFLVQFFVVIGCLVNTSFHHYVYEHYNFADNRFEYTVEAGTRLMGIALNSSNGSIACSSAVMILSFAFLKRKLKNVEFMVLGAIVFLLTLFIGRTGVLVELAIFFVVACLYFNIKTIIMLVVASWLSMKGLNLLLGLTEAGDVLLQWMSAPFDDEKRSLIVDLMVQKIPPLTSEMIFGTGIMRGTSDSGIVTWSDSGYIMLYSSLGIVGASIYYFSYYKLLSPISSHFKEKKMYYFILFLIFLMFVIEYKEPFILFYIFPHTILLIKVFNEKLRMMS